MANITLMGASYTDVPAVDLPKTGGGTVRFYENGGAPSATQHTILFEFEDTTSATITAYYDSAFISDAITATTPTAYGSKTVTLAQLDGVTWYDNSSETWETMADQTCAITADGGVRHVTINSYNEPLSADETYRITWGDTQYICNTIADPVGFTQDGYYMGNSSIFGSQYEDTGEPFVFYRTSSTRLTGATNDTASSVYVKIER